MKHDAISATAVEDKAGVAFTSPIGRSVILCHHDSHAIYLHNNLSRQPTTDNHALQ